MISFLAMLILFFSGINVMPVEETQEITGKAQLEVVESEPTIEPIETAKAPIKPTEAVFNPTPPASSGQEVQDMIVRYSNIHGSSAEANLRIAACESGYRANAVSPSGTYVGVFQFHPNTFNANVGYMRQSGLYVSENASRWNAEDNINVATWMLANGQQWQWTCK